MAKHTKLFEELRALKLQKPFRPFRIVTKEGKHYTVGQWLWVAFNETQLVVLPNGGPSRYMKISDVDSVAVIKRKPKRKR
jgi:hypothetical protein